MKQYVYVMSSASGLCKVGIATDPEKRRKSLERGSGFPVAIEVLHGPYNSARSLECVVHKMLEAHKCPGEWFACSAADALAAVAQAESGFSDRPDKSPAEIAAREAALDSLIKSMLPQIPGIDLDDVLRTTRARSGSLLN